MKERNERKLLRDLNTRIIISLIKNNKKGNELRLAVTVSEASTLLRLNKNKIYALARTNKIPNYRDGNRIIIPIPALVEWLYQSTGEKIA